jgi:transglutaminase-like putative cysteine protease
MTIAIAALTAASAWADGEVLHEFVPNVDPNEPVVALAELGAAPEAIVYDGELLTAPSAEEAAAAPPMVATEGDGTLGDAPGQRSPSFRPDRLTALEGTLAYYAAFTPSIAPFKRVSSLDAVRLDRDGKTPVLGVRDARRRALPVEGADAAPPDSRPRDRFWGEARLDFRGGRALPLPSVSPESRILSVRTEPATDLSIERDGAGNYFAVQKSRAGPSEVFVAFLTDAPRSYFAAELPRAPVDALARELPPLDDAIRARALELAAELGVTPRSELAPALSALTAHFRAFEESAEPPPDSGDVFVDLVRAKKGVCRHRAYGFAILAMALGIPAHFVQNEAHSWVEVKLPRVGWMRIDLGGAAHGLQAHGASDRPQYHAALPDPLPRPPAYEESYSLLGRNTSGLRKPSQDELAGRWVAPAEGGPAAQAQGGASFMAGPSARGARDISGRAPLAIALTERRHQVQRGGELALQGRVQDGAGQGVAGLRIEVSLAAEQRRERMLLGVTVSGARGEFDGRFGVPPDLAAGDYRLVVVTPGDDRYLPALAE